MAIKDMFKVVTGKKQTNSDKQDEMIKGFLSCDNFPIMTSAEIDMKRYNKIPFAGIAALGSAFSLIPESSRTIVQTVTKSIATKETLFMGINAKGIEGFLRSNEYGTTGNIIQINEQGKQVIAGRMRFKPLENGLPISETTATVVPFDPMTLVIAAALFSIDQKLSTLQEKAEEILQFLVLEKQSKQRGNLNTLVELLEEYKQKCNEEDFCKLRCIEVQAIKREAQQDIIFYQEQVGRKIQKQKGIHISHNTQEFLDSLMKEFYEYQLSCYLYGFASFMEVLLYKDFNTENLENVIKRMEVHAKKYNMIYNECHASLVNYQRSSVDTQVLGGIGKMTKNVGEKIAANPLLGKGPVDELLIGAGNKLYKHNRKALNKKLSVLEELEENKIAAFVKSIRLLDNMYNQSNSILTDGEYLYIAKAA